MCITQVCCVYCAFLLHACRCDHCAPWAAGTSRIPSSSFCLLMKLFIMRITVPQMQLLLEHTDSPYIRAVGFLYLRYTCPPKEMWKWLEPYIDDQEEVRNFHVFLLIQPLELDNFSAFAVVVVAQKGCSVAVPGSRATMSSNLVVSSRCARI
jgi:PRP38 family